MNKKEFIDIATRIIGVLALLILVAFGALQRDPTAVNEPEARGVTNFDSLTLSDDLVVGGAAAITGALTQTGNTDIAGTLQFGADDLYPVGFATSGQQAVYGTDSITGTLAVTHGLTTVTFCLATLGEDPEAGSGDAAHVTVAVAANACTVKAFQDDFVTAATETDVVVHWLVIGAP